MLGVAVKIVEAPEHAVVLLLTTLTVGVTAVVTIIVITLLVAVAVEAHKALPVSMHVIWSLLFKAADVNEGAFPPTFIPFTCH